MRIKNYSLTVLFILCASYVACAQQQGQQKPETSSQEMKGMDMDNTK